MLVFGFDIGTKFGWASFSGGALLGSGAHDLSLKAGEHPGQRYLRLAKWLDQGATEMIRKRGAASCDVLIAYEDVQSHERRDRESGQRWFATTAAHVYGGLRAIVEGWAAARGYDVLPVGVGTWKAALGCTGGSRATKGDVMRCVRLMQISPATQDEADAIGVAFSAERTATWNRRTARPGPTTLPKR